MAALRSAQKGFAGKSKFALSLGLALTVGVTASRSAIAQGRGQDSAGGTGARSDRGSLIHNKERSFRIPFNIDKEGRAKIKEVQLWASKDLGEHWDPVSKTTADRPSFTFRAARDGEYWFAVRILSVDGKLYPSANESVDPGMKVLVDTKPPLLNLEADGRRGTVAAVRWEVSDENLDLKSLAIEYQAEGVREWRKVPIGKPTLIGSRKWDVGTADAVRVRATISDKAGNTTDAAISLPEGVASLSQPADGLEEYSAPPSISRVSDSSGIMAGPGFGPVGDDLEGGSPPRGAGTGRLKNSAGRSRSQPKASQVSPVGNSAFVDREPVGNAGREQASTPAGGSVFETLPASPGLVTAAAVPAGMNPGQGSMFGSPDPGASSTPEGQAGNSRPQLIPSPRFSLQYAVEDAGPSGRPASVQLWVTHDNGRTWGPLGEDPDQTSPINVDLGGDGMYGIRLVSRSASGLGDQPPGPGDRPDRWVEVDSTPPLVQLNPVEVGTGAHAGKVGISWRSTELHPAPRSTRILWRPDLPGSNWQPVVEGQENTGQFVWAVPPGLPGKLHLRIESTDAAGHMGSAETTDSGAILVDRSRPKSRIIGLDPNARAGSGNSPVQMR